MRRSDQGAHIRERLTTNRSDLTLQGGLTNTARICPVGLYMPTILLPALNYRNQPNDIWSVELNVRPPNVNNASPFLRDYSTTPGVGCWFLYFRSKTVLGLPVSTTSYSRYAVSTNSNMISRANNGTVLNRLRRD